MNLKGSDSLPTTKQEKIFLFTLQVLAGESLNEGDKVEYVEEEGRKGLTAAQVHVINE